MPRAVAFSATSFLGLHTTRGADALGPGVNSPGPCFLSVAENVRFTQDGGVRVRNGYSRKLNLGTGNSIDDMETHPQFDVLFFKSGTGIYQTINGTTAYTTGVTRTSTEKDFLFPYRKNIFATNQTDSSARIAVSTVAAINSGAGTFSLRTGDGEVFASGTVYIRGIAVTGGTLATDDFTGCTGLTAAMAVGDIVTQSSTPSGFPRGNCMGELEGSALVSGVSANPAALYWGSASSVASPSLFWDFPAIFVIPLPSDGTAIKSGSSVTLIGMKKGMMYSPGFDQTTGTITLLPLSTTHSIPNGRCIAQMEDEFVVLTSGGRILPVAQTDAGFRIIQNIEDPKQDMDFPVQGDIQKNMHRTDFTQNFIHYDPSTREVSATILLKTGITAEYVLQRDIRAWSKDTGKTAKCKSIFLERTYAGSDNDSLLFLDNSEWADDGIPINWRITLGLLRPTRKGTTTDFDMHTFGGLLNATGQFYMRVIVDGAIVENKLYKAIGDENSLTQKYLMDVDAGISIGGGQIGAEQIGTGGEVADAFPFTVPYEFLAEGEQATVEFEGNDEGAIFELRHSEISGETEGELLLNVT